RTTGLIFSLLILPCAGPAAAQERRAARPRDAAPPAGSMSESPRETIKPSVPTSWSDVLKWRCIGPANMGGRITAIAVSEKDSSTWWVASASGGLLKTVNNGITFEHQFDHEKTVSIGDVAVAASDPNI